MSAPRVGQRRIAAPRVAIATCRALPDGDEDAPLIRQALAARSIDSGWFGWDDETIDWDEFDLTVIRSTWDYTADRDRFLAWARSVPRLHNPAPVLAWNSDKRYLRDLAEAGIATVPTWWIPPGDTLDRAADQLGAEYVLKPTVGAGSKGAGRFATAVEADRKRAAVHLAELHAAGRTVMVQPYLADVDTVGETGLIYFDGEFSHAIAKSALLGPSEVNRLEPGYSRSLFVEERIRPRLASTAERRLGNRALAYVHQRFGALVYARIDVLPSPGGPVVIEVEVTEPSLFLSYDSSSPARLAATIASRLTSR